MKKFFKSFIYSARGIASAVRGGRNMRIHIAVSFYVIISAFIVKLTGAEWRAALICIALVLVAELVNTSIETLCDAVHPGRSAGIGRAKDMAAGAVLICAVVSAVIGGSIFFRADKLSAMLEFIREGRLLAAACFLTLPAAVLFIIGRKNWNDK